MPQSLLEQYPEELTIVIQHQFWDLIIDDDMFSVTLSFGGRKEHLEVPFNAITGFADPSVQFGLQFKAEQTYINEKVAVTKTLLQKKKMVETMQNLSLIHI